jgi:hypothetical protein
VDAFTVISLHALTLWISPEGLHYLGPGLNSDPSIVRLWWCNAAICIDEMLWTHGIWAHAAGELQVQWSHGSLTHHWNL